MLPRLAYGSVWVSGRAGRAMGCVWKSSPSVWRLLCRTLRQCPTWCPLLRLPVASWMCLLFLRGWRPCVGRRRTVWRRWLRNLPVWGMCSTRTKVRFVGTGTIARLSLPLKSTLTETTAWRWRLPLPCVAIRRLPSGNRKSLPSPSLVFGRNGKKYAKHSPAFVPMGKKLTFVSGIL